MTETPLVILHFNEKQIYSRNIATILGSLHGILDKEHGSYGNFKFNFESLFEQDLFFNTFNPRSMNIFLYKIPTHNH